MKLKEQIINECLNYRKKKKVTQRELGELIGKHTSAIGRFEIGTIDPRLEFVELLLNAMGKEIRIVDKKKRREA